MSEQHRVGYFQRLRDVVELSAALNSCVLSGLGVVAGIGEPGTEVPGFRPAPRWGWWRAAGVAAVPGRWGKPRR